MAAYLTEEEAQERLARYGYEAAVPEGYLEIASSEVDSLGPYRGRKAERDQELAFPRRGDPEVPAAVLDATALLAYGHATGGEEAPVTSEKWLDASITYASPVLPAERRLAAKLLWSLQRRVGEVV